MHVSVLGDAQRRTEGDRDAWRTSSVSITRKASP